MFEKYICELRKLIIKSIIIILLSYVFSLLIFVKILSYNLTFLGVKDVFGFYFDTLPKLSLLLSLPFLTYIFYIWLKDALREEEQKRIEGYFFKASIFYVISIILALFLTPRIIHFSKTLANTLGTKIIVSPNDVVQFFVYLFFALFIIMHIPSLLRLLNSLGLIDVRDMKENRPIFYLAFYIIAALVSPGDMLLTDIILFIMLVFLFESTLQGLQSSTQL